jgi:hypothetical protein
MQREQQQQKARAFWESDLPMHIRDFNEDATPGTIAYITKSFMWNFWSATGTYTQQARTSALPPEMITFIKDSLKARGEWVEYDSGSDECQ